MDPKEWEELRVKGFKVFDSHGTQISTIDKFVEFAAQEPGRYKRTAEGRVYRRRVWNMEKRGVVYDESKTKAASQEEKCPQCGATLDEPNKCPNCGTEPFERKPDAGSKKDS